MSKSTTLKLVPITPEIKDDLTEAYLAAFEHNAANRAMIGPLTPETIAAVKQARSGGGDMAGSESGSVEHDYAIVDTSLPATNAAVPEGAIIGRGTWKVEDGREWRHPVDKMIVPGTNGPAYHAFFGFIDDLRNRNVGGRRLWHLTFLFTHPRYGRRGAGRFFVEWGTSQADRAGMDCYLDGTEAGRPLYEKCGFEVIEKGELDLAPVGGEGTYTSYCMLRKPKPVES